jgi:3-phenylpropionate/cinnamic acid dioxygenase small subunit
MPGALEDREAIRELLAAYCFALDECRFEEFGALFAADAEWGPQRIPQKARGPAEIAALAASIVPVPGEGPKRRHLTTNILIRLDGDRAEVKSNFLMVRESASGPLLAIAGTYLDQLVRSPAGWRFRHREILNDIAGELGLKR